MNEEDECCVCFYPYTEVESAVALECSHDFCIGCMLRCATRDGNFKCPKCRKISTFYVPKLSSEPINFPVSKDCLEDVDDNYEFDEDMLLWPPDYYEMRPAAPIIDVGENEIEDWDLEYVHWIADEHVDTSYANSPLPDTTISCVDLYCEEELQSSTSSIVEDEIIFEE